MSGEKCKIGAMCRNCPQCSCIAATERLTCEPDEASLASSQLKALSQITTVETT